eukprot:scaffold5.g897.t1
MSSVASDEQFEHGVDGLCPRCSMLGRSRFFSRLIPGYSPDPVLISRFICEDPDCGAVIDEVQLAGRCGPAGLRLTLTVPAGDFAALGRTLVKADTAAVSIPELEFEISPNASVPFQARGHWFRLGDLATVAGCLRAACANLSSDQEQRFAADPERASLIQAAIEEVQAHADGKHAFTLVLDDPAGNSFIGGPVSAGAGGTDDAEPDPQLTVECYQRSPAQNERLGLGDAVAFAEGGGAAGGGGAGSAGSGGLVAERVVLQAEGEVAEQLVARFGEAGGGQPEEGDRACGACGAPAAARRHCPPPPFVRACALVDARCDACGARSAELRSSGTSAGGRQLVLAVEGSEDLDRAVVASNSASLVIPELGLAFAGGAEGVFTTVGGLVRSVLDGLTATQARRGDAAAAGDAEAGAAQQEWREFAADLCAMLEPGGRPWTLQLTDPQDNRWRKIADNMEDPAEREQIWEKRLRGVKAAAQSVKDKMDHPTKNWGFWRAEKHQGKYEMNANPTISQMPGRAVR